MALRSQLTRGWLYGLVFTVTLFFAEGIFVALSEPAVPLWTAPFNVGVGAPLAFAAALFVSLTIAGWSRYWPAGESPSKTLRRWLWQDTNEQLATRTGWILAVIILVLVWGGVNIFAFQRITMAIATPVLAGMLMVLVQLGVALFLTALSAIIARILASIFIWFAGLHRFTSYLIRPASLLANGVLALVLGLLAAWKLFPAVLHALPWAFAVGPAAATLVTALALYLFQGRSALRPVVNLVMTLTLLAAGLFTLFMPMSLEGARQVFVGQSSVVSAWYNLLHPRLDFDGDGSIFFYAGGDCAPFDPDRGPHQLEIIGDGIDQNCSGFDLVVDPADFHKGQRAHPRPTGIVDRPHIILITTDALSFPNTTVGGYGRDTTPNLARWAENATVFESAFATGSSTRLAMPALVASMYNSQIPMKDKRRHPYDYAEDVVTFGSVFKEAGYRTIFIPSHRYFLNWKGFQRGFDEIDTKSFTEAKNPRHPAREITDSALQYLDEHDDETPLFLWIHYYDHHGPYSVPEGGKVFGKAGTRQDRFDSELHFADQHWGRLMQAVEERFDPEEYLMLFTADHGEAFDENHPRHPHGYTIFTRPLHVPLIIQGPSERGTRVEGLTGHLDVLPTLANIIGTPPLDAWRGESLVPVLFEGEPIEKSVIYSLHYIPEAVKRGEDGFEMWGVRTDEFYYIENHRRNERRLVRWRDDPLDRPDLFSQQRQTAEIYRYVAAEKVQWWRENERALTQVKGQRPNAAKAQPKDPATKGKSKKSTKAPEPDED